MSLTVQDVLGLEAMRGAQLLAGARGLSRPVLSATVMDAPDGALWFKSDEIAFTSTYPLMRLRNRLQPFIADLANRGISGLGVKLTRYMTEIPAPVLESADRLGFPIISLPAQVSWIELINPIITNVIAAKADQLRRNESIYGGFTESLVGGSHLAKLAELLSEMVGNPVVIDCESDGITSWSERPGAARSAEILSLLRSDGQKGCRLKEDIQVFRKEAPTGTLVYIPLAEEAGVLGRIAIIEQNQRFDINDIDCLLHAQKACSIKVMQLLNDLRARRERESTFVCALIDPPSSMAARQRLLRSGRDVGYELKGPHAVIACWLGGLTGGKLDEATKAMHVRLTARGDVLTGFPDKDLAVLILNRVDRVNRDGIARLLHGLHNELAAHFPRLCFVAGVSHRLSDFDTLRNGFMQAEQARKYGGDAPDPCTIRRIDEIGLFQLFSSESVQAEARRFVEDWLGALVDYDNRKRIRLVPTLRAYLEANGNHREAAKRLHLHHNSVRYRIGKICKLTGHDVTAPGFKLQYELALALKNMFDDPTLDPFEFEG